MTPSNGKAFQQTDAPSARMGRIPGRSTSRRQSLCPPQAQLRLSPDFRLAVTTSTSVAVPRNRLRKRSTLARRFAARCADTIVARARFSGLWERFPANLRRHRLPLQTAPTTRTPLICDNFSANPGDRIEWVGIPAEGCILFQHQKYPWPFSLPSPIKLPASAPVTIKSGLAPGDYLYNVTCCIPTGIFKVVTVA